MQTFIENADDDTKIQITPRDLDSAIGFGIGTIGAAVAAIGGYLLWGSGAAMLVGGSSFVLMAAMMIVRNPAPGAGEDPV